MSHELRTPLNSIIGFTGILLQELVGPLNPEQKKQMGMVRGSSGHLLELINDVLDISKIEAGQLQVGHEPVDLNTVALKVAATVQPLAQKKGLTLNCELPDGLEPLSSDRRRVEQILMNLLGNAIKFTDAGEVRMRVSPAGPDIRIEVIDTGIGIAPEHLDHLFQPFFQIDIGLTRKYGGTGLGLSISKRLTELLGGRIRVDSVLGRGSTFTVLLPRVEAIP
jgi:signal transduction histidine kinase